MSKYSRDKIDIYIKCGAKSKKTIKAKANGLPWIQNPQVQHQSA